MKKFLILLLPSALSLGARSLASHADAGTAFGVAVACLALTDNYISLTSAVLGNTALFE